ncbi:MAG: RagB/SusD family nutrient uptake outer membrane protein [Bacteroidales bacterium]|nr:RagB/SusD family nutrient uptake outer membrane protein [Bacteroidales bacterium]
MKKTIISLACGLALLGTACTDDLNQYPVIETDASEVYATADGYKMVLAKIYASYAIVGQEKAGNVDLSSFNGQDLLRGYFNLQEAATDETAMRWLSGDNLSDLSYMSWSASDPWVSDTYYRLYYNIALCNEFLRYCDESHISGFTSTEQADIAQYSLEARFMRALSYYLVLDLFRQGPYVDENTPSTGFIPEAYTASQLFSFIESEIEAIADQLPLDNEYGRAGRAAAWAVAMRLYLNAQVYTGQDKYAECLTYCQKIINSGKYSLEADYQKLFNADNYKRTNEIILGFVTDANTTTSWGAGTYLVCGSCGSDSSQDPAKYGLDAGWGSWRVRGELPALFGDVATSQDCRCMFWTDGQAQYIDKTLDEATQGYYSEKFTNLTDDGVASSSSASAGCDTDVPFFRLAEVYLSAAEAVMRGASGMTKAEALDLVNALRERAYGDQSGNITVSEMTLQWILDERGREMYHEMVRRTDLVRYDQFTTSSYLWQWKGGVVAGRAVESKYNYYPIPSTELTANPNLVNKEY